MDEGFKDVQKLIDELDTGMDELLQVTTKFKDDLQVILDEITKAFSELRELNLKRK